MHRQKITLTEDKETLLIPLYAKAVDSRRDDPILGDTTAGEILTGIDYDFDKLKLPRVSFAIIPIRAKQLDAYTREYLAHHNHALVLHLGCGLDGRAQRVGQSKVRWYDLDHPEVIELRRRFYRETGTYHMIGSSVLDFVWMDAIAHDGPAMIVAEGLLMYLQEAEVKGLLLKLRDRFPKSQIVFDAFGVIAARAARRNRAIKQTGAEVKWWINDARAIEQWGAGIRLLEERLFTQSEDIRRLDLPLRAMFMAMRYLPGLKKAHRIMRFQL